MARSGTVKEGGFTEAQMEKFTALDRVPSVKEAKGILGRAIADNSTIAGDADGPDAPSRRRPVLEESTRTVAQVARDNVAALGVLQRLNFWGSYQTIGGRDERS
jgi:hypothetical protein